MEKLFPKMRECPEGKHIALGGGYWVVYQIALPFILTMVIGDMSMVTGTTISCAVGFWVINLGCTIVMFRSYLRDSFWTVRLDRKRLFASIGLGLAALAVLEIPFLLISILMEDPAVFFALPMADPLFGINAAMWMIYETLLFGVCFVFLAPVTMCCLYYAVGFAAPAQERPWLGYLIVALLAMVPAALLYTSGAYELAAAAGYYVSVLPFHMCACWVYQRSDTIWGPILFHVIANLLSIPVFIVMLVAMAIHSLF